LRLSLTEHARRRRDPNRVVHDLGTAGRSSWELGEEAPAGALLSREVELDPSTTWLLRCDRVDFEPGGIAYRHTHPGRASATCCSGDHDRLEGARAHLRSGRGVVRARARPGARRHRRRRAVGVRAGDAAARRSGQASGRSVRRPRATPTSPRRQRADDLPPSSRWSVDAAGGQVLVDQLVLHGADLCSACRARATSRVLDALHDAPLRLIVTRHEGGAANMAEAYGKLTGRPACAWSRAGRGDARVATASTRVPGLDADAAARSARSRARLSGARASRSVDYRAMFGPLAKWATQIDDAARLPEIVAARSRSRPRGAPGRSSLALPGGHAHRRGRRARRAAAPPVARRRASASSARLAELLAQARAPL
jgi:hypothetical protein